MRTASIAELKARLSEFLAAVRHGEDLTVTDRGRAVARISAVRGRARSAARTDELIRSALARPPRRHLPPDFLKRTRPADVEGRSLRAVLQEREGGW